MQLEQRAQLQAGVPTLFIAAISLAAIGLFLRMSPAIETILRENQPSLAAAEEMLAALAEETAPGEVQQQRFLSALATAEELLTEAAERPVVERIKSLAAPALRGDSEPRRALVAELGKLSEINRQAMAERDIAAKRLGISGAWAVMFLGALGFGTSLLQGRRLARRIAAPLDELYAVTRAFREGDSHRRARDFPAAPAEIRFVRESLNLLLDERLLRAGRRRSQTVDFEAAARALVELQPQPCVVLDAHDEIVAANSGALDALTGEQGQSLRASLSAIQAAVPPQDPRLQSVRRADPFNVVLLAAP